MSEEQLRTEKLRQGIARTQDNIIRSKESEHTKRMSVGERNKLDQTNRHREETLSAYRNALKNTEGNE